MNQYSGNLQRVVGNRVKGAMYMKEIMLKRLKPLIIQLITFGITYSISFVFRDRYFFSWLIHNNFAYIWVVMIIFTMFGKYLYSYAIAIGNIIGILLGQVLGEYILKISRAKIATETNGDKIRVLENSYYHVYIWLSFIIIVVVLVFINKLISKKLNR